MSRAYGMARAIQDRAEFQRRIEGATDEEIVSRIWVLKMKTLSFWRGFTAPSLLTPAGRAYRDEVRR